MNVAVCAEGDIRASIEFLLQVNDIIKTRAAVCPYQQARHGYSTRYDYSVSAGIDETCSRGVVVKESIASRLDTGG